MALALQTLERSKWMNDILAVGLGVVDGYLLQKSPWAFLLKNIGVPIASLFTKIPDSIKYESEGMLGLTISVLLGVK